MKNTSNAARLSRLMPNNSPRWVRCYDAGEGTFDRYTICFTGKYKKTNGWFDYLISSEHPSCPQGFGQAMQNRSQIDANILGFAPAIGRKNHLGKRVPFSSLPKDVQKFVLPHYRALWGL